jgi:hypothetical protein
VTEREAWANLADGVSRALAQFAVELRAATTPVAPAAVMMSRDRPAPRGKRQGEVLALPGISSEVGMTAGQVAAGIGVTGPNAYKLLESLVAGGWLEVVPDVEPGHWRSTQGQQ